MVRLNIELPAHQIAAIRESGAGGWFTPFDFANCASPDHPKRPYYKFRYAQKSRLVHDWIDRCSPGARVLDLFCANGAFAIRAAQAGETEVVGIDAEASRITVANLLAEIIEPYVNASMRFHVADVHDVEKFGNQFDIVNVFWWSLSHK